MVGTRDQQLLETRSVTHLDEGGGDFGQPLFPLRSDPLGDRDCLFTVACLTAVGMIIEPVYDSLRVESNLVHLTE